MRLKYIVLIFPLLVSTGCASEYIIRSFMNGATICHSTEMNGVVKNRHGFRYISEGYHIDYARSIMGTAPAKSEKFRTFNGIVYYVDYFQVEPGTVCGGKYTYGEYEKIYYLDNKVVGKKNTFYRDDLASHMRRIHIVN